MTPLQYYFYGMLLTIDTLCRGALIDAAYFFNIRENILNVILGGELWPSYRGDPVLAVNVCHYKKFPVTRKVLIFRKISKFYFREVGQGTVTKFFSLTVLGRPRIMIAKIWPLTPENLVKMGCNFFGCGAPRGAWGQYCNCRLKLVRVFTREE